MLSSATPLQQIHMLRWILLQEQARMRLNETMRNKHLAPSYANNKDERAAQVSVCLGTSSYDAPQY